MPTVPVLGPDGLWPVPAEDLTRRELSTLGSYFNAVQKVLANRDPLASRGAVELSSSRAKCGLTGNLAVRLLGLCSGVLHFGTPYLLSPLRVSTGYRRRPKPDRSRRLVPHSRRVA